jgi:hypothetical protein
MLYASSATASVQLSVPDLKYEAKLSVHEMYIASKIVQGYLQGRVLGIIACSRIYLRHSFKCFPKCGWNYNKFNDIESLRNCKNN